MILKQIYNKGLGHATYFIASEKEAVVIDPIRDIDEYLGLQKKHGVKIKYIFMTHLYAEMLSGHLSLAKATGASIVFGANTSANFEFHKSKDGEQFVFGDLSIQTILTPGHSVESASFLLYDTDQNPFALFAGNSMTLAKGANSDLKSIQANKEELAAMFYNSIYNKVFALPESTLILSSTSITQENIESAEDLTLGYLKENNALFRMRSEGHFMEIATKEIAEMSPVFLGLIEKNKNLYEDIENVIARSLKPISVNDFNKYKKEGVAQLLDVRQGEHFTLGFIPMSINIGLQGEFEFWAIRLLDPKKPIVLIAEDEDTAQETIVKLARVGIENVLGYLEGGLEAWVMSNAEVDMIIDVEADEFALDLRFDKLMLPIDVRSIAEYDAGYLKESQHLPLEKLIDPLYMAAIDDDLHNYVFSGDGYRSVIACSVMKREGFVDVRNVLGGYKEIEQQSGLVFMLPKTEEEKENEENEEELD